MWDRLRLDFNPRGRVATLLALFILIIPIFSYPSPNLGNSIGKTLTLLYNKSFYNCSIHPLYFVSENWLSIKNNPQMSFDSNGTIMINVGGSPKYHPFLIASYAAHIYRYWYNTNDTQPLSEFQAQIRWLRENEKRFGDHSVWYYDWENPSMPIDRKVSPHWSALSNGYIIAVLIESYALFGNNIDLEIAWRALKSYRYPMTEHGFLTYWDGTVWYEEEAANATRIIQRPSHILNGMMYAVGCAKYVHDFNGSEYALSIFNDGITAIKRHAQEFDTGMWQNYSMLPEVGGPVQTDYMYIHMNCFRILWELSGDPEIYAWYHRSKWMKELMVTGYSPLAYYASSTVDPVNHSMKKIFDKRAHYYGDYLSYWSGVIPCELFVDLGESMPINFIGYLNRFPTSPRNWTVSLSNDNISWTIKRFVINSLEPEKAIIFEPYILARYIKIEIFSQCLPNYKITSMEELIIANMTEDNLEEAKISIEKYRFKHIYGQIIGKVPQGTFVWLDENYKLSTSDNYSFVVPPGQYILHFDWKNVRINRTINVSYAQISYCNLTIQDFLNQNDSFLQSNDGLSELIGIAIICSIVIITFIMIILLIRHRRKI